MCSFSQKSQTLCSWLSSAPNVNRHFLTYCMSGYAVIMVLKKYSFGRLERKKLFADEDNKSKLNGKGMPNLCSIQTVYCVDSTM